MVLLLMCVVAAPIAVTAVKVVDYGVYETIRTDEVESHKTSSGKVHVLHPRLDPTLRKQTDRIEGRVGVHFGLRFQVDGTPRLAVVPLLVRVKHPAFTNPTTGKTSTLEEWKAESNIGIPRFTGWAFDQPYEVASGEWTIQILRDGKVVIEKTFVITH